MKWNDEDLEMKRWRDPYKIVGGRGVQIWGRKVADLKSAYGLLAWGHKGDIYNES